MASGIGGEPGHGWGRGGCVAVPPAPVATPPEVVGMVPTPAPSRTGSSSFG